METTPLVFRGELYRFEVIRDKRWAEESQEHWDGSSDECVPCLHFVNVRTNEKSPLFAENHTFGFPIVVDDTMYVVTGEGRHWGSDRLVFFRSDDLIHWEKYAEHSMPGWKIYNMNIAKMNDTYTLMIEISEPLEERGPCSFTFRFLQSKDMTNWTLTPSEYVFQRERYAGSPALYTLEGDPHYYVCYLEAYPEHCFANCIARSKDLIHWEYSLLNPVLMYDEYEDKKIGSPFLTPQDRARIDAALDINNSDMEFCEFLGRTIIYYSWGRSAGYRIPCGS